MTFAPPRQGEVYELRTDEAYRNNVDFNQKGLSPLVEIASIDLISDVTVDAMHTVYISITKKILGLLVNGQLPENIISELNNKMLGFSKLIANRLFDRKPRALMDYDSYKASECRVFELYLSYLILDVLPENLKHFRNHLLKLCIAISIFESTTLKDKIDLAYEYFIAFYRECDLLYGRVNLS